MNLRLAAIASILLAWAPGAWLAQAPANDACDDAVAIGNGTFFGSTDGATNDGGASCGFSDEAPDVWFAYSSPVGGTVFAEVLGSGFDPVLSVHLWCPGTEHNEWVCSESHRFPVAFDVSPGAEVFVRVSGFQGASGPFTLNVGPPGAISGRVTDAATGLPLASIQVQIFDRNSAYYGSALTDPEGAYTVTALPSGTFVVQAGGFSNYLAELYDDVPCPDGFCDLALGTPVAVRLGEVTAGIDFALDLGGTITGTVKETSPGSPIPFVGIEVFDDAGFFVANASTLPTGRYTVGGLRAGTYFVRTRNEEYRDELFDDIPCPKGACDPTDGTPIAVELNATVAGVDFELDRLGGIFGIVTDAATGDAIPSIGVVILDAEGGFVGSAFTDFAGAYRASGLVPGAYLVRTDAFIGHVDELYDDVPCPRGDCELALGTPVEVALAATTEGVDFALGRTGSIAGRVSDAATGDGVPFLVVNTQDENGAFHESGFTDVDGLYTIRDLVPGELFVWTYGGSEFLSELYDGVPCPQSECDLRLGAPVAISAGVETPGIDFRLDRLGAISGRVTDVATGDPIASVDVEAVDVSGFFQGSAATDADGRYTISGLQPGAHHARTSQALGYLDELYDGVACPWRACEPADGTPIAVAVAETTAGVDFELSVGGSLSGRVTDEAGAGLEGGFVEIYDGDGRFLNGAFTGPDGSFELSGLAAASYFVTGHVPGYGSELYDDLPCPFADCDPTTGTPVPVSLGAVTADVDFALEPLDACDPSPTVLCLSGGRFRVEVSWRDFVGASGAGRGLPLTGDTGYFWFFDPGNVELVVKVLDACDLPGFETFWVFAAGLTDVEVELTVTDTVARETRVYTNDLGVPFAPIQDTAAFSTCFAGKDGERRSAPGLERRTAAELERILAGLGPDGAAAAPGTGLKETCLPDTTVLCLNRSRFRVEVPWRTPEDESGAGLALPLTSDTGYFWFFDADNVELVVKVLDACDLPGFENYWVYAAGLTDVEVTLRVTDTDSGEMLEWNNPQGNPFQPITDTRAFDTCP